MRFSLIMLKRYLHPYILKDLDKKIVILSGARQTGKTTLSKMLSENYDYINFDYSEHRLIINKKTWDRKKDLIIFDELHKYKNWKAWLKGIYDTEGLKPKIIVTGSSKLDTYKKVGDSLAGRYFKYRIHPFDLKELYNLNNKINKEDELNKLLIKSGFPEPFLEETSNYYNKWKQTHTDIILKQDLVELEKIIEINSVETLVQLLRTRVGSPVSYASLARDLQCSDKSVKKWLNILENMYVIFKLTPYHNKISRSLLKAPKYYFYDTAQVLGDEGAKLENLVAFSLLKEQHFQEDVFGKFFKLYYLKNKNGFEVDFLICENEIPKTMIEVKLSENKTNFHHFNINVKNKILLLKELNKEKTYPNGAELRKAENYLCKLDFQN